MAISSIQSSHQAYSPLPVQAASGGGVKTASQSGMSGDTVQVSDEARALARQAGAESQTVTGVTPDQTASSQTEDYELPLEAYALPDWFMGLTSELNMVDTQIGIKYYESRRARYDALSTKEKDDLAEYNSILHGCFRDELKNHGIENSVDYYREIVQNLNGASDQVEQAVKQRLGADPRAMQLMEYFGLSLES